jgi:hypothetical protein
MALVGATSKDENPDGPAELASVSIGADDILVIAPYSNQVGLIRGLLPDGARVGTVDEFQGPEALVVAVMSEELLDAAVRTPEQLRQVDALCRLVEMATTPGHPNEWLSTT